MNTIYFSHPYGSVGTDGEERILTELRMRREQVINPFDSQVSKSAWAACQERGYYSGLWADQLVSTDRQAIRDTDSILVWLPAGIEGSVGTYLELAYAYGWGVHVEVIHEWDRDFPHPWLMVYADAVYLSIDAWITRQPASVNHYHIEEVKGGA